MYAYTHARACWPVNVRLRAFDAYFAPPTDTGGNDDEGEVPLTSDASGVNYLSR